VDKNHVGRKSSVVGRFIPGWICGQYFDLIWSMFSEAALTFREPNQRGY